MKCRKWASKHLGVCSGVLGLSQNLDETTEIHFRKIKSVKATVLLVTKSSGISKDRCSLSQSFLHGHSVLRLQIKWLHKRCGFANGTLEGKN